MRANTGRKTRKALLGLYGSIGEMTRAGENRYRRYRKVFILTESFVLKFNAFLKILTETLTVNRKCVTETEN